MQNDQHPRKESMLQKSFIQTHETDDQTNTNGKEKERERVECTGAVQSVFVDWILSFVKMFRVALDGLLIPLARKNENNSREANEKW